MERPPEHPWSTVGKVGGHTVLMPIDIGQDVGEKIIFRR